MAYAIAWNEAAPVGSSVNASTIDTELQNLKKSIRERMNNILSNAWETDASDPKTLDVQAIAGTPRVARVVPGAVSLLTTVNTVIDFGAETFDTDSFHDNAVNPSRLTVPVAGYYLIHSSLAITSGAAAGIGIMEIRENGTTTRAQVDHRHNGSTTDENFQVQTIVLAAASDYFEIRFLQSSGDTWTTRSAAMEAFFEIMWISGAT